MVTELGSYPFSSYPAFIGQDKEPKWLEISWLISLFGQSRRGAAKNYRDFASYCNTWQQISSANAQAVSKTILMFGFGESFEVFRDRAICGLQSFDHA